MTTATVRQLQRKCKDILLRVKRGQRVFITSRGKRVACVIPGEDIVETSAKPNFMARLLAAFPDGPVAGKTGAELIADERSRVL